MSRAREAAGFEAPLEAAVAGAGVGVGCGLVCFCTAEGGFLAAMDGEGDPLAPMPLVWMLGTWRFTLGGGTGVGVGFGAIAAAAGK